MATARAVRSSDVPAFVAKAETHASWNPHVSCRATVTNLRRVLGTNAGPSGGAMFAGGGFKPGIPDRRALHPPCKVNRIPTYVQLPTPDLHSRRSHSEHR